ncbi:MAG: VOC family protein [Alphaproteobacteria bacterium]|nr:VOC family protein [Alphaproteobacteria bacterium]
MHSGIAGIDHIIVAVRDLERARDAWVRLGFIPTPRGRHLGHPTANYCIMFGQDYIELLGSAAADDPGPRLGPFLAKRQGPMQLAFAPNGSAVEARAALLASGLNPAEIRPLGRELAGPEGPVVPRFSLIDLPPEETPGLNCFVCSHLTPELMRRPEWLDHPNGVIGIKGVHILVAETAPLLPAYDQLFGIQHVTTTDAVAAIQAGPHRLLFSTPDDFMTMHPGIDLDPAFPLPGIVAIDLAIASGSRTAAFLQGAEIPFRELAEGTLVVPASEACGTLLFLSPG